VRLEPGHEAAADYPASSVRGLGHLGGRESAVKVSFIIVSWNARDFLVQCLDSLFAQADCYPMEVIVVDNASTDGSVGTLERRFPQVRLIVNSTNLGFAKANNLGILASSGQYVCLVNSDVRMLPCCIHRLVEYCEEHPEVGMVGPRVIGGDGKLQRSCRGFPSVWNMFCRALALDVMFPQCRIFTGYSLWHWPQDSLRPVDILSGCFWLVRRQALARVGMLDESFFMYGEDMDWCKRFRNHGWRAVFVPAAEAIHYGGASSANAPMRFYVERHRADLRYWQKHHSSLAVVGYFALTCLHLMLRAVGHSLVFLLTGAKRADAGYKVRRSLVALGWMLSAGLKQCGAHRKPVLPVSHDPPAIFGHQLS
jgi:GT2 family glycosyltransferase